MFRTHADDRRLMREAVPDTGKIKLREMNSPPRRIRQTQRRVNGLEHKSRSHRIRLLWMRAEDRRS